ncbi:MAG: Rdx family protein [Acidobacteria bacterium]|nr:Rdx family protein [Acidobacteriota bacterium]
MAEGLLKEFEQYIDDFTLIPSRGGVFEVQVGDTLVYSKIETERHAEYEEVAAPIRKILDRPDPEPAQ